MKGVRILLAFVGVGWVLAGAGAGMSAIEYGSRQADLLQREWDRTASEFDADLKRAQADADKAREKATPRIEKAKANVDEWQAKVTEAPDNERNAKKLDEAKAALADEQSKLDDALAAAKTKSDEILKEKQTALAQLSQGSAQSLGLWSKIGPFLGAFLGLIMVIAAIALGFLRPSTQWSAPAEPVTDPGAVKPAV